jgi:transcriptional regulator with XRE-family HTH domain
MTTDAPALLARRIALERTARDWSLADLAARSGVSKAAISKIERQEMSPTAVTLVRLAGAFDLTLAGLLVRAEGANRLSRAATQPVWQDPETGYRRRQVFAHHGHPLELVQIDLPAGKSVTLPASSYAHIRQTIWVQQGDLVITEAGERHALQAGDCLGFGTPSETVIANEGAETCVYLVTLARA